VPSAIAFFPWIYVDEPRTIGSLKLLPYNRGELPGNLAHISQEDIERVLGAYADRPAHPISRATILEFGDWQAGDDTTPEIVSSLFRVKNLVAFSALSHRTLFERHTGYCNYDTYTLVVQRFHPGEAGTFAFDTRRRDGRTSQLWSSNEFAFHRPNHVTGNNRIALDQPLLFSLLSLPDSHKAMYESLVEFNAANTDSPDVPSHVEIVMCKSAFEWLLEIDENSNNFIKALSKRLDGIKASPCEGPIKNKWKNRWPDATHPLLAWAKEFCAVRGSSAHGTSRKSGNYVWQIHQHLAFVAILFPLLFKKVLADDGLLVMDNYDLEKLRRIDSFLVHDPFDFDWNSQHQHPWAEIKNQALICASAKRFYPDQL
jgi:hypothetical protein